MKISDTWEFRKVGDTAWMPATVPGSVHTDLLSNGKIDNPFYRLNEKEDWDIYSEVMKSHQHSSIGNETIEYYLLQDYMQAEGIRIAMEGHRTNMPYCMGSLYWQIDYCWPVASWFSIWKTHPPWFK